MIANKTTSVTAEKSVAEIQKMLAMAKATAIIVEFDTDGSPSSIAFALARDGVPFSFRLPCNWAGTLNALKRERGVPARLLTSIHAKRVAWRAVRDWLRAQLTLIESGASTIHEVMLPWALTARGVTVSNLVFSGNLPLLKSPTAAS